MSENAQPIFNDFKEYVDRMKAKLSAVDEKCFGFDDEGDECAKYREKLSIYANYTDDLVTKGFQYLDVIDHFKNKLDGNNSDALSICSNSSVTERTLHADLNFIRNCLENRTGMEEKAFDSLVQGKLTLK